MSRVIGAIDCGTNSTRILVIDEDKKQLFRDSRVTRLGQNVDKNKLLDEAAVARTLNVLNDYLKIGNELKVSEWGIIATSAVRDSANSFHFVNAAKDLFKVRPVILSGYKEAVLSFKGAMSGLAPTKEKVLVVDIGGGSTELICGLQNDYFRDRKTDFDFVSNTFGGSVDIGCVRLTERFINSDPIKLDEIESARQYIARLFSLIQSRFQNLAIDRIYAVAGTAISLFMIANDIKTYSREGIHMGRLGLAQIKNTLETMASMPLSKRQQLPGLEVGRAEVIVAGALILSSVMESFKAEECFVLESDILDGLAIQILG